MTPPAEQEWINMKYCFKKQKNSFKCAGARYSKHIKTINPRDGGSLFYNYKKNFASIILVVTVNSYRKGQKYQTLFKIK
jgi:hypothetical protein